VGAGLKNRVSFDAVTCSFVAEYQLAHPRDIYVAGMYWSFATFLTIGYGDITATCTETRVLSMFVMLIGST
jgi:hypothetical protein